eukprot:365162-Chlamydomonas_euryale.AAC.16
MRISVARAAIRGMEAAHPCAVWQAIRPHVRAMTVVPPWLCTPPASQHNCLHEVLHAHGVLAGLLNLQGCRLNTQKRTRSRSSRKNASRTAPRNGQPIRRVLSASRATPLVKHIAQGSTLISGTAWTTVQRRRSSQH